MDVLCSPKFEEIDLLPCDPISLEAIGDIAINPTDSPVICSAQGGALCSLKFCMGGNGCWENKQKNG